MLQAARSPRNVKSLLTASGVTTSRWPRLQRGGVDVAQPADQARALVELDDRYHPGNVGLPGCVVGTV